MLAAPRCCGLLFKRLGEFAATLLLRLEQPRVLDGDHRLVSEGRYQLDLHFGKRVHLIAGEPEDADRCSAAQKRHSEDSSVPKCPLVAARVVFGIG